MKELSVQYKCILADYIEHQTERNLYIGQNFIRQLIQKNISPEEVINIHKNAMQNIFIGFYKKATREKVGLKLVGLTNRLMRLFEITGLKDLMIIEVDEKVGTGNESI